MAWNNRLRVELKAKPSIKISIPSSIFFFFSIMYTDKASAENNGHDNNNNNSNLQIKQDNKFFCRLLSKETSISNNPSFRVTPVVTVPFLWESHPGTPKHPFFSDLSPPPLTPPPSYFYNSTNNNNPIKKKTPRSNLFRFSFSRFNLRKTLLLPSSLSSSLSLSSSSFSSSESSRTVVGSNGRRRRRRFSSCDSSVDLWGNSNCDEDEDTGGGVVVSGSRNLSCCFGFPRSNSSNGGFGGCHGRQAN